MRLIWLPLAQQDIDKLYHFYYNKSPKAATNTYNLILDEIEILSNFPHVGQPEPKLGKHFNTYRSLVIVKGRYRVYYFINKDTVFISSIRDCRQNPEEISEIIEY